MKNINLSEEEQAAQYKIAFLNKVFFFAGIVALGMGFIRWQIDAVMGMIDFGFAGLAFALLLYLRRHKEKIEFLSSVALILSLILFFAIFLLAPYNTTRSSLFFLLSASAFYLKGRKAGFLWLIFIIVSMISVALFTHIETAYSPIDILTMSLYLIALFFIFDSYETIKGDQTNRLKRSNLELEEKIQERTTELQQVNRLLEQLNEDLEKKVKERTQQLLEAQEELVRKESLAVLGKIADNVGHELRNPLGVMNNAVYFLQTVLPDAEENVKEYLDILHDEIASTDHILSDLLDAVRTKPPQLDSVEVGGLLTQALKACSIPEPVRVQLDVSASCPLLQVDPLQMQQVFRNLINNAAEAMPKGGTLEIRANADAEGKTLTISVRDNGSGIAPEILPKLFQPMFTTKTRRIGLGLVVVKNLTEANGGSVRVQSEPGKGSTFSITLPAIAPAEGGA